MLVLLLVLVQVLTLVLIIKVFETMEQTRQIVNFFVLSKMLKGVKK